MSETTEKTYSIKTTARLVDMNTHTIRAWERRYKALDPNRNESNNRRQYSERDITRLTLLAKLVKAGHQISHIAPLSDENLSAMVSSEPQRSGAQNSEHPSSLESQILRRCISALEIFDLVFIHAELESARHVLSARGFLLNLAAPMLRTVGEKVFDSSMSIAQEHAITSILRAQMMQILFNLRNSIAVRAYSRKDQGHGKVFCLATMDGDLHEFGILAAAILVAHHGHIPYYFGPNLPADALAQAAKAIKSDFIVIGSIPSADPGAEAKQRAYATTLLFESDHPMRIWWGGDLRFSPHEGLSHVTHMPTLTALEQALERL